jgi:DNA-binding response OmpR family regulator
MPSRRRAHEPRGLKAAREFEPDIVLCDIGLPDADGHVVGSVLRQSSPTSPLVAAPAMGGPRVLFCALPVSV